MMNTSEEARTNIGVLDQLIDVVEGVAGTLALCCRYLIVPPRRLAAEIAAMDSSTMRSSAPLLIAALIIGLAVSQYIGPIFITLVKAPLEYAVPEIDQLWASVLKKTCMYSAILFVGVDLLLRLSTKTHGSNAYPALPSVFHVTLAVLVLRLTVLALALTVILFFALQKFTSPWHNVAFYTSALVGIPVIMWLHLQSIHRYIAESAVAPRPGSTSFLSLGVFGLTAVLVGIGVRDVDKFAREAPGTHVKVAAAGRRPFRIVDDAAELDLIITKDRDYGRPIYIMAQPRLFTVGVYQSGRFERKAFFEDAKGKGVLLEQGKQPSSLIYLGESAPAMITLRLRLDEVTVPSAVGHARFGRQPSEVPFTKATRESAIAALTPIGTPLIVTVYLTFADENQYLTQHQFAIQVVPGDWSR